MIGLEIIVNMEGAGERLQLDLAHVVHVTSPMTIGGLARGMASGNASVMLLIQLPDGRTVAAETSLKLWLTAADMLRAHYGDQP